MRHRGAFLAAAALFAALAGPLEAQQPKRKIYISVDMEGVAGVVTGEQLGPTGFEYERFRGFMTNEALAAIEGARAAGATEILVSDSHGNGQNLLIERFPKDVQIVRAWPRPLAMMEGIDGGFDAVLFVGYHSSTVNPEGVRAHTMSSANLADVRLNGVSVPEAGLNAAIAGHFRVPVAMISGDAAAVKEAQALLGPIEGAVVKWPLGFHSARTLTPEASCDLIRATAKKAVERARGLKPYDVKVPVTLDVRFKNYRPSEVLAYLPIVERTDAHSIRFRGKDMLETIRFLEFLMNYEPGLSP
ncbi:MAG: M55 family metallopeptidase [Thermoanaerobaculia bacterium]|jgi:D-amino peptidase